MPPSGFPANFITPDSALSGDGDLQSVLLLNSFELPTYAGDYHLNLFEANRQYYLTVLAYLPMDYRGIVLFL